MNRFVRLSIEILFEDSFSPRVQKVQAGREEYAPQPPDSGDTVISQRGKHLLPCNWIY